MNLETLITNIRKNSFNDFVINTNTYLKEGGNLNDKYEGYTLLGHVCQNKDIYKSFDLVKLLVENGADIHANDSDGFRYACINGKIKEVEYFLEKGVDVTVLNNFGIRFTPVENVELIKLLVENGADPLADNALLIRYILTHNNPEKTVLELITFFCEKDIKVETALSFINYIESISKEALHIIKINGLYKDLENSLEHKENKIKRVKL